MITITLCPPGEAPRVYATRYYIIGKHGILTFEGENPGETRTTHLAFFIEEQAHKNSSA